MLRILVRKQLTEIFRGYFYDAKKNQRRSAFATATYFILFALLMLVVLGGMFTFLSIALCKPLAAAGMDWLYFALMGLLAIFLGAFGSVFNTYAGLYLAKDNDLLLSMPIPVNVIMSARLLGVYLMGLLYSGVVILPAVIVYWANVSAAAKVIAGSLLLVLLISVFVLTLSCALGWVVARVSVKLKHKSFVTVLLSLLLIAAYYLFYFNIQSLISDLLAHATLYGGMLKGKAYPVYLFGRTATGDPAAVLLVTAVILALFALTWAVISRSFLRIATSTGRSEKRVYRERAAKSRSVGAALFFKELGRFVSSPSYMLNCGLGVLMLPVSGVVLLLKGGEFLSVLNQAFAGRPGSLPVLLCAMVCILVSMNDMTAPSVSLEGKTLWLVQSLPVTPWQVLRAKLFLQLALTYPPVLLCVGCAAMIYPYPLEQLLLAFLLPLLYGALSALLGLALGLKFSNLTWTSEIVPIKQGAAVLLTLLSGFAYGGVLLLGCLLVGDRWSASLYMGIFSLLTLVLCTGLYFWLKRRGCVLFSAL